jgi:heptaprenyl diphosphate synthase
MTSVYKREWNEILQRIRSWAAQPYVERTIGKPEVPVFFVRVLHLMLKSLGIARERAELYAVATTLLQMGLDIHEQVPLSEPATREEERRRQLLVLSGDYYSSLFYWLLARKGEWEGIRRLADAVCLINERKMTRHGKEREEGARILADTWEDRKRIAGGLLTALADFFHADHAVAGVWRDLVSDLMLLDWLKREADQGKFAGFGERELSGLKETVARLRMTAAKLTPPEIRQEMEHLIKESFSVFLEGLLVKEG